MAVMFVNYDEPNPESYESVGISMNGKDGRTETEFKTGNFVKDWYDCVKHIIHNIPDGEPVLHSSSVDHFIMDGANFDSKYLTNSTGDIWDLVNYLDCKGEGIEFFVEKGTAPTWKELKKICEN